MEDPPQRTKTSVMGPVRALVNAIFPATYLALILLATLPSISGARQIEVGPGKPLQSIREAAKTVKAGDSVLIHPGVYREAVVWKGGDLNGPAITVRGMGSPRPVVDGTGVRLTAVPRALFQVEGDNYVFENIEFRNARNGQNAAGVRLLNARKTVLRHIKVTRSDMGIMSTYNDDFVLDSSEIAFNGTPLFNGLSHNIYISGNRARIQYCYIHDATNGQNVKTRSRYVELLYNYIADAHDGIDGGTSTKEIGIQTGEYTDRPHSHAVLIGNIIVKRGRGTAFLDFGPERGSPLRNGVLFLLNNTIIRENPVSRWMLHLGHRQERAVLYNNIFYGFREFAFGPGAPNISGSNNWFPDNATVPPELKYTLRGKDPGFLNLSGRDYRLTPTSTCIDQGGEGLHILDGADQDVIAAATSEYRIHLNQAPRPKAGRIDIGALEYNAADLSAAAPVSPGATRRAPIGADNRPAALQ